MELVRRETPTMTSSDRVELRAERYWGLFLLVSMLAISMYLFLHTSQLLDRFQGGFGKLESGDTAKIRQYNEKLESLQDRMTVFIADSVENRIGLLEKSVEKGSVGSQEIKTLEDLKSELRLLESFAAGKRGDLTDTSLLDHARFHTTPGSRNSAGNEELLGELVRVKSLLYFSLASCGLMAAMIGGYCYWWRMQTRSRALASAFSNPPLLTRESGSSEERAD